MKNKENQKNLCGIYIGNNFSGIAINGKIISNQRIKNQTIIPTIIAFEKDRKDSIIGENIQTHLDNNKENTIYGFINLIGKKFSDSEVQKFIGEVNFKIKKKNENEDEIKIQFNQDQKIKEESPEYFLRLMVENLIRFDPIITKQDSSFIITIPSYFDKNQKELVNNELNKIGLKQFQIINEAQALIYSCKNTNLLYSTVFIFCCNENEVNISVLKNLNLEGNIIKFFQKNYYIEILFNYCLDYFKKTTQKDFSKDKNKCNELRKMITVSFENLSPKNPLIKLEKDKFYEKEELKINLDIKKFKEIFNDFNKECEKLINELFTKYNITKNNIDFYIFNCSLIPSCEKYISKECFKLINDDEKKIIEDNNKYQIYPIGASLYVNDDDEGIEKYESEEEKGEEEEKEIKGESPIKLSLGFDRGDGIMTFVIKKGEKKRFSQKGYFETEFDNQKECDIKIYRGERLFVEDNVEIGNFKLKNLILSPKGSIITLKFHFNIKDNSLKIIAFENKNQKNKIEYIRHPYQINYNDMEIGLIKNPEKFKEIDNEKYESFLEIEELKKDIGKIREELRLYENDQPILVKNMENTINEIHNKMNHQNFKQYIKNINDCQLIINELNTLTKSKGFINNPQEQKKIKELEKEKNELNKQVEVLRKAMRENKFK